MIRTRLVLAAVLAVVGAPLAQAEDPTYHLSLKDHHFVPDSLDIPADTKVVLLVKNEDPAPEEFDSHDLRREKVIPAGKEMPIQVGPLKPGSYKFIGEYHEDVAKGVLVVK